MGEFLPGELIGAKTQDVYNKAWRGWGGIKLLCVHGVHMTQELFISVVYLEFSILQK